MSFKFTAPSALGAALMLIASVAPAHSMTAPANPSLQRGSGVAQGGTPPAASKPLAAHHARALERDQARHQKIKQALAARQGEMKMAVLYAAVPGAVQAVGADMLATAMGSGLRLGESVEHGLWVRASRTDRRPTADTTLRSRFGQLSTTSRLDQSLMSAQIGTPIYGSGNTRVDATLGMGGSRTEVSGRARDTQLNTYAASLGLILEHRMAVGLDLRLGTQIMGGTSELKGAGQGKNKGDFKQKFKHQGIGLRAEAGWGLPLSSRLTATPLIGMSANLVRVKQNKIKTEDHTTGQLWAGTRLAYQHDMQNGRTTSLWVEPTYISQVSRTTTVDAKLAGLNFSADSRLPRSSMGARIGADIAVGKQGSIEAGVSRFWAVGSDRHSESAVHLGYVHRI